MKYFEHWLESHYPEMRRAGATPPAPRAIEVTQSPAHGLILSDLPEERIDMATDAMDWHSDATGFY